jgi:hypothetical protein
MATEEIDVVASIEKLIKARLLAYELAVKTNDFTLLDFVEKGDDEHILGLVIEWANVKIGSAMQYVSHINNFIRVFDEGKEYFALVALMMKNEEFLERTKPYFMHRSIRELMIKRSVEARKLVD